MENFNKIYKENKGNIFNYVYFKIRNKSIAEELTDDVFIKANNANFDSEKSAIYTWLVNIANNLIIDYHRAKTAEMRDSNKTSYLSQFITDNGQDNFNTSKDSFCTSTRLDADMLIVESENRTRIAQAFRGLSVTNRKVAIQYFLRERTYNEIANDLSMSLSSVKTNINRSRVKLQTELS